VRQYRLLIHRFRFAHYFVAFNATAHAQLSADLAEKIDKVANDTLAKDRSASALYSYRERWTDRLDEGLR